MVKHNWYWEVNNMKKLFLVIVGAIISLSLFSQNSVEKLDDAGRIILSPFISSDSSIPASSRNLIINKLNQIVSNNGIGGQSLDGRFILTANVEPINLEVTPTAPPMKAYTLAITLYVGDGIEGTLFSSASITTKGVGDTDSKAYNAALKNFKPNDPAWQKMIEDGKQSIIAYYNSHCDLVINEARTLAKTNNYEEAIAKLMSVPQVCKDAYDKAMAEVPVIYSAYLNYKADDIIKNARNIWDANQSDESAEKVANLLSQIDPSVDRKDEIDALWSSISSVRFTKAKAIWASGQDARAAKQTIDILAKISPTSSCYKDALALISEVEKRVKELDQREWESIQKEREHNWQSEQDERERKYNLQESAINAAKEIGVAWGKNQKPTVYNIRNWW